MLSSAQAEFIRRIDLNPMPPHVNLDVWLQNLMENLKSEFPQKYHWVGVYWLREMALYVGPYAGPITHHTVIPVGQGVCGTAVAEDKNQVVSDVRARSNYLACNIETRSEIVVLIRNPETFRVIGQIDADGTAPGGFDAPNEEEFLTEIARRIANHHAIR